MTDLEYYKELTAKYFQAKEHFKELYRIVTVEAKGYWQCLENKQKEIDALKARRNELVKAVKALKRIDNWAKAYPLKAFPKLTVSDYKRAAEVLKANGLSLDRIPADNMRYVLESIKGIVEKALDEAEKI